MSRTMMSISSIRGYKGCHPLQLRFLCHMTLNEKSRRYYYKCLDDITTDTSDLYDSYDLRGLTNYIQHSPDKNFHACRFFPDYFYIIRSLI